MDTKLIQTLEQIMDLALEALTQAKKDAVKMRQQFKLLQFEGNANDMTRKIKLPPNVREFRPGYYQGRKTVDGTCFTEYAFNPDEVVLKLNKAIENAKAKPIIVSETDISISSPFIFGAWLIEWQTVYKAPKLRASSMSSISNAIKLHIPNNIKALPLTEITPAVIDKSLNAIPFSRQRQVTYFVYTASLRKAYMLGYVPINIAERLEPVTHEYDNGVALTIQEQEQFLKDIKGHPMQSLFLVYLYTGCRRNEALSLKWEYLDRAKGTLFINGTKTKLSKRTIPMSVALLAIFDTVPKHGDSPFIFRYAPTSVNHEFKKLCPTHRLNDLRHTFDTRAHECGIQPKVIQKWMGHSKLDITERIYNHVQTELENSEANKFTLQPNLQPSKNLEKQ